MKPLIRLFFRSVRFVASPVVVTLDRLTTPRGIDRPADDQARIDQDVSQMALYHFQSCPFCIKTRRFMKRQSLPIELRDAQRDPQHREALLSGGGAIKVPCLRIDEQDGQVSWMYESSRIIEYLGARFPS